MRLFLCLFSALVAVVSSQSATCFDVFPRDCVPNKAFICSLPAYRSLAQQYCRYSCEYCSVVSPVQTTKSPPSTTTTRGSSVTASPGGILDPSPSIQSFRTSYLNTNAVF